MTSETRQDRDDRHATEDGRLRATQRAATDRSGEVRRDVLRLMWPGRRAAVVLGVAVAAMTVLPLAGPQLTRRFVDDAIAGAGTGRLTLIALAALAAAVAGQAARLAAAWLASRLAWDGTDRLRERLAGHALGLDMDFHGRHTPGELIERVDGDVVAVSGFVVAFLMDVVAGGLLLAGVIAVVFAADPRLGAALLAYCVLVGFGTTRAQRLAVPSAAAARAAQARLYGEMEERLAGAEDIRANGAGGHVVSRFLGTAAVWYRAEHRADRIGSGLLAGTSVAFAAGTALMLALAAWARASGTLTVGTAVLVFQCTVMVRTPFERLIDRLRDYQGALAGITRIGGLLAERRTLPAPARPRRLPASGPLALELDAVAFGYDARDAPEERVLVDVTLSLAPGETLGLVGRTGSGKTTITRLVLRLYDPVRGAVRVGGLDLRDVDAVSLRERVCAVTQDVRLFGASVRDNLTLFRPSPGDDRLRRALADAGLGEWLAGLPDGLDTELRGVSAGEAQLLAFARAFLADPGLVVLDEASSRLDPATERRVERGMDRLLAGRTGVIVAHRLSSLARVDKIAVMSHGRVVEYGRREELAADPGSRFARLLKLAGVTR
ncbi:ABC transporter ATP-binding protein [Nonomuraea sp. NPDC005501]|uniref:ABC transporter ATP-binding protein n=1 Tax=Nonomuraea sp. NPDC005501 TaxID=3156884 RepID=UPI0033A743D0